jgi:GNAT superfamily N-acetyltransferase
VTSRVRTTAAELDETIADVRGRLRELGFTGNVWHVGPSSRPEGLAGMLRERGFVPATRPPYESVMTCMVLVEPPTGTFDPAIEVRLVSNLDEYVQALRVAMASFNESEEDAAGWMAAAPTLWASQDGKTRFTHIAYLAGKPVGFGWAAGAPSGILLGGSGVLPEARGRGVYRAMLAARWAHSQEMGCGGVAIQAGAMSRPILERCGFQVLCQLEVFEDLNLG